MDGEPDDDVELAESAETFDEAVARVVAELDGIERRAVREGTEVAIAGRPFGAVAPGSLEVRLDPAIAAAALRTPGVGPSDRGRDWVRFTPPRGSRSPLDVDRAIAWLGLAYRAARRGR